MPSEPQAGPSWAKKKKVILLRSAWRRGFGAFLRQGYVITADILVRRKHLVFRMDVVEVLNKAAPDIDGLKVLPLLHWGDIPEELRDRLVGGHENLEWGHREWFDMDGRKLWLAEIHGKPAGLSWVLSASQDAHFWCPMPPLTEVCFQTVVLPEFRGCGLQVPFLVTIMKSRVKDGIQGFFASCHEYNYTPHRNILEMGFHPIGYCKESRWSRRKTWHPTGT